MTLVFRGCRSTDTGPLAPVPGAEGGPCYSDSTCDGALICTGGYCIPLDVPDTTTPEDTTTPDTSRREVLALVDALQKGAEEFVVTSFVVPDISIPRIEGTMDLDFYLITSDPQTQLLLGLVWVHDEHCCTQSHFLVLPW